MTVLSTDVRDFLLDADGDFVITTDLSLVSGLDAIVQECRIRMRTFLEEWFLNLDVGVPWYQRILGAKPAAAIEAARTYINRTLLQVEGVTRVAALDVTFVGTTRALRIAWQVQTAFGDTPVDVLALRIAGGV